MSEDTFLGLGVTGQLPYVFRHFYPYKGRLTTAARIYTAIFLPRFVDQSADPDFVLCEKGGRLGWAYAANAVFDADGNGTIQVHELEKAIRRNAWGPRWRELCARAYVKDPGWGPDITDVRTIAGLQHALQRLKYPVGEVDGFRGPRTEAALRQFQKDQSLAADGIPGPKTRAALERALVA